MKRYNVKKAFTGKRNRRIASKAVAAVKNRYVSKKGLKYNQIARDVYTLKRALNVEKKRIDVAQGNGVSFGQFAGATTGMYATDITPAPAQGITGNTRNGLSIKLVSACMDIQINQSTSCNNEFRYKWFIVCRPDASLATNASVASTQFFENNLFSGVIDYHSNRDPEYYHQFRVLKTGYGKLTQDQIASQTSYNQFKVPLRLKHHLKFNTDASTTTTKNQLFLFIVADSGDSTLLTGGQVRFNVRYYFVDN